MLCDCVFRVFGAHIGRKEDGAMLVVIPSSETHIVLEMQGKKRQLPGLVIFWFCFNNLIKLKLRLSGEGYTQGSKSKYFIKFHFCLWHVL